LKRIAAEKTRLIKEGKTKKEKSMSEMTEEEKPFELPISWKWIHLAESGVASTGGTPKSADSHMFDGEIPFIGPGQISPDGKFLPAEKYLTEEGCLHSSVATDGDILMVCIGGSIGKSLIVEQKLTFNQQINCISPIIISSRYLNS
jgi:type I restriction enzyme S subunit